MADKDNKLLKFKIGLVKKKKDNFQLLNYDELVQYFIISMYPDIPILVIFDINKHISNIPRLQILKRDNYQQFMLCEQNEIGFIQFPNINSAFDFISSVPITMDKEIKWRIYLNNKAIYRSKI